MHTGQTDPICYAQWSNYIAATHNITHSPCTLTCMHFTPTTTHHTAFHNPPLYTTNKHKAYLCKLEQNGRRCRDGVEVFWCHSQSSWLVLRVPYPHALVFVKENFFVTSSITIQSPAAKQWPTFYTEHASIDHDFGKYQQALQNLKDWKNTSKVGYSNIILQMFTSLKYSPHKCY